MSELLQNSPNSVFVKNTKTQSVTDELHNANLVGTLNSNYRNAKASPKLTTKKGNIELLSFKKSV